MDMESKITAVCDMQATIISCLKTDIDSGLMNVDIECAGKAADIVKDLSETEKNLRESKYYQLVAEAMKEKKYETPDRYGYSPMRENYDNVNRNMGYKPMMDQEPYINGYLHDPEFEKNMRQGYNEYGMPYTEYMTARRHYTETKSMSDKAKMDARAKEHIDQTIETLEDIWEDATPELRAKMKSDIKTLMDNFM